MAREPGLPGRRPGPLGARGAVLLLLLAAALASAAALDLGPGKLAPGQGGLELAGRFFARAVRPAIAWEADVVPPGTEPLLVETLHAMGKTVLFAAAAMALSLVLGVVLGFLGSTAWWEGDQVRAKVAPALVGPDVPAYSVEGTTSIVSLESDVLGKLSLIESDPGPHTTAYGLLADFLNAVK